MQRVVVGVDGSENSRRALAWALDEARVRNACLDVVHTWEPPLVVGFGTLPSGGATLGGSPYEEQATLLLDLMIVARPPRSFPFRSMRSRCTGQPRGPSSRQREERT